MVRVRLVSYLLALALIYFIPNVLAYDKGEKFGWKPDLGASLRTPVKTSRTKRSSPHIITECLLVTSDEGRFFVKAREDSDKVCGVYFMSDPDQFIQLHFDYFDIPCEGGGLAVFVDGWELEGHVFPSPVDHAKPFDDRFEEVCGVSRIKQVFASSQNAALLQYRLPRRGQGFSFTVQHATNPRPCNILTEGSTNVYTLRNYGRRANCSVMAMFPGSVRVLAMRIGPLLQETGFLYKCRKRGFEDYLEVGGTLDLDNTHLARAKDICGLDSKPERQKSSVFCPMTTARLVSSGDTDNSVTLTIQPAEEEDFLNSDVICQV